MLYYLNLIATAVVTFGATNLDDIVILMVFFAQCKGKTRPIHVIIGQYLGFMAILLVSMTGFVGSLFIPTAWTGLLGLVPMGLGIKKFVHNRRGEDDPPQEAQGSVEQGSRTDSASGLGAVLGISAVTFANGGDNIGIYVPLFASSTPLELLLIVSVFLLLVLVLCVASYYLARRRIVADLIARYGEIFVPLVLVLLGIYILAKSDTLSLFF